MQRSPDAEFNAHNNRVEQAWRNQEHYQQTLTPDQMISDMETSPSHEKFLTFDKVFREILDAQVTIHGANRVAEEYSQMKAAYNKYLRQLN